MKILIYTSFRTGCKTLGDWLESELRILYYHEPFNLEYEENFKKKFNLYDMEHTDPLGCIVRIIFSSNIMYDEIKKLFNKHIILYREDTKEQAESFVWAQKTNNYHFNRKLSNLGYYSIDDYFLNENKDEIKNYITIFDKEKEHLKSLEGLKISYEELFIEKTGLNKIYEYLNFKSKTIPNSALKLRNNTIKTRLL